MESGPSPVELPFNLLILKVYHAQKNRVRPVMGAIGLSPGQPKVLTFLALHGPCLQKELAASCDIEAATVSKLLHSLEELELIERNGRPGDRRAAEITLTPAGRELFENEIAGRIGEINATSLSGFSESERAQFISFLKRMYRNLTGQDL